MHGRWGTAPEVIGNLADAVDQCVQHPAPGQQRDCRTEHQQRNDNVGLSHASLKLSCFSLRGEQARLDCLDLLDQLPHWQFVLRALSILVVDLTLSGDNAVVIAAAAKPLPRRMRNQALVAGAACAVVTLVAAAFFATRLLHVEFLQLIGGAAILLIAVGLFRDEPPLESSATHLSGFWKAMWFIVVADVTMSTDNILAVAAIAQGDFLLLLFGLGLSIPLVVFASGMLARVMDNYPVIVYVGAALLGRVAGQMIMTDAFTVQMLRPSVALDYSVEAVCTMGVIVAGVWIKARRTRRPNPW
jgi:YjbE family integral membrane protein